MSLAITGFYASLTALLVIIFAYRVIRLRREHKIGVGVEDNTPLLIATRVHGNMLENAPLTLILMMATEINGMSPTLLHCFGSVWIVSRLLHAVGLTLGKGGAHFGRYWGTLLTWLVMLGLVVVNCIQFFDPM
ncbi:MAPEG family protein [uncultured Shewanella sp.]|uniref:MAPEG family protein n=1 Tax=uncultured Shewanella sp. TaxID=173975 RepID=UPI002607704E|nr:MAPEG family protein [uncultured Shewanella sp.]